MSMIETKKIKIIKKKKFEDIFLASLILPVLLIALWEFAAQKQWINVSLFPSPGRIVQAFFRQIQNGKLPQNIMISLQRVILGYIFGAILGVIVGIALGLSKKAYRVFSFILELLRPIPIIAWVPVLIMWLGIGESSKVVVIIIGSFWPVFLNTYDGIRNVSDKYIEVAAMFRKTRFETITRVMVPAALPYIFTGLRIGIGSAWVSVIGAELIAAAAGLGFMISYSRELAQPANMYVAVFTIGIIGYLINVAIKWVEKRALRWNA